MVHLVRHRCPDDVVEQPAHGRLAKRRVIDNNGVGHRDDQRVSKQHHAAFGQRFVASDLLRITERRILQPVGRRLSVPIWSPACNAQLCRNQSVIK